VSIIWICTVHQADFFHLPDISLGERDLWRVRKAKHVEPIVGSNEDDILVGRKIDAVVRGERIGSIVEGTT
jgi:hypothetical protein